MNLSPAVKTLVDEYIRVPRLTSDDVFEDVIVEQPDFRIVSPGVYDMTMSSCDTAVTIKAVLQESAEALLQDVKRTATTVFDPSKHDAYGGIAEACAGQSTTQWKPYLTLPGELIVKSRAMQPWNLFDGDNYCGLRSLNVALLANHQEPFEGGGVTDDGIVYIGVKDSIFPPHVEDMQLYSLSYNLKGAPKIWDCIPASHATEFRSLVHDLLPNAKQCPNALHHKNFLLDPQVILDHNIPIYRFVHKPGTIMLTAPGAIHFGFNTGTNIAVALSILLCFYLIVFSHHI